MPGAKLMALHKDLRPILAEFCLVLIFTGSSKVEKKKKKKSYNESQIFWYKFVQFCPSQQSDSGLIQS